MRYRNFAMRREENTLEGKCAIINRNIFGDDTSLWLTPKELDKALTVILKDALYDTNVRFACIHIQKVLEYYMDKRTRSKPYSLETYTSSKLVGEYVRKHNLEIAVKEANITLDIPNDYIGLSKVKNFLKEIQEHSNKSDNPAVKVRMWKPRYDDDEVGSHGVYLSITFRDTVREPDYDWLTDTAYDEMVAGLGLGSDDESRLLGAPSFDSRRVSLAITNFY